jgi:hypothetical protein
MATPGRRELWEQQISTGQFVLYGPMPLLEDPNEQVFVRSYTSSQVDTSSQVVSIERPQ